MTFFRRPPHSEEKISARWAARIVLALGICGYVAFYTVWTLNNYTNFSTFGFDLGIHDQAAWLLSKGVWNPFITISGSNYFGDHLYWIMYVLVPFYWLFHSAKVLLVFQSAALGLAAVPAFLVAREKLRSEWLACGIAWAYLLNPYVGWANIDQFHPDVFEVVLVFLAFLFILRRRWWWFFATTVVLLLVKEDVALLIFGMGIWVAVLFDRKWGFITAALSAVWFFVNFRLLLPALGGTGSLGEYVTMHANRIPFGGFTGFVRTVFTKPWRIVEAAFARDRWAYYLQVLAPTAFLPFLSPSTLLAVILPLAANGISTFYYQHSLHYHYGTLVVPGLIVAAIFGIAHGSVKLRRIMVCLLLVCAALGLWLWGPVPGSRQHAVWASVDPAFSMSVQEAIKLIPDDAVVSVEYHLLTQIDHRVEIYEFPNPWYRLNWNNSKNDSDQRIARVQYVLLTDFLDSTSEETFLRVQAGGDFVVIYHQDGVLLLKRAAPGPDI